MRKYKIPHSLKELIDNNFEEDLYYQDEEDFFIDESVIDDPEAMREMLRLLGQVSKRIRMLPVQTIACVQ